MFDTVKYIAVTSFLPPTPFFPSDTIKNVNLIQTDVWFTKNIPVGGEVDTNLI